MTILRSLAGVLPRIAATYPPDPRIASLRDALLRQPSRPPKTADRFAFAVQSVEDPFYFALFGAITAEIARRSPAAAELVIVRAVSGAVGVDWRARLRRSILVTWILSTQWVRAFAGLADRIAFRSHSWSNPVTGAIDAIGSLALWRKARRAQGDLSLEVLGVPVGDLISDSYLRFRPSPRFDVADPFVLQLIRQAHRGVRRARRYFRVKRPRFYLTSYSTYLEHGMPVRVALQEGIRVHSFGSLTRFDKQLSLGDWYHTNDCSGYRTTFAALDDQQRRLAEAERQLTLRLAGGIDAATSYMRASAYEFSNVGAPSDLNRAVIVFLHDFYDSPHIYPEIVFGDFWRWASFTIETLSQEGINFYLKPHPNQVQLSGAALHELKRVYPAARFLPPGITTKQLGDAGIASGVTVYGTIAHELAYLGVPSVACAKHPHTAFEFCRTARTEAEYGDLLRTTISFAPDKHRLRSEALAFYYMHNLFGTAAELDLRSKFIALWKNCHDSAERPESMLDALEGLRRSPAFSARVAAMIEERQ